MLQSPLPNRILLHPPSSLLIVSSVQTIFSVVEPGCGFCQAFVAVVYSMDRRRHVIRGRGGGYGGGGYGGGGYGGGGWWWLGRMNSTSISGPVRLSS